MLLVRNLGRLPLNFISIFWKEKCSFAKCLFSQLNPTVNSQDFNL